MSRVCDTRSLDTRRSRNMLAHCLLPALLLLTAVDCTGDPYPYKVLEFKGIGDMPLVGPYNLYLRDGQCKGVLKPLNPTYVQCPLPTAIVALEVTVKDYKQNINIKITDDLNGVEITREQPCLYNSTVELMSGCA